MAVKQWLQEVSVPIYILVMLFSTSAWIDINGVWTELPLMVSVAPEGWSLMSYLVILIQTAGIIPLVYAIVVRFYPHKIKEWPIIYVIIITGVISCLMLVFFWDFTLTIFGAERSVGLFLFVFTLAIVDCSSTVVYLPYMDKFKPQYITAKYTGEGLGTLITGTMGFIQGSTGDANCINVTSSEYYGVNEMKPLVFNSSNHQSSASWQMVPTFKEPRFSIEVYFAVMCGIMITSCMAFTCLHFMPFVKKHYKIEKTEKITKKCTNSGTGLLIDKNKGHINTDNDYNDFAIKNKTDCYKKSNAFVPSDQHLCGEEGMEIPDVELEDGKISQSCYIFLLVLTALMAALQYGLVPSTQSYACLPYGNMTFAYAVRGVTVSIPLAYFLTLFIPRGGIKTVTIVTSIGLCCCVHQIFLAALSPNPPLQEHIMGRVLVIFSDILLAVMFCFSRVYISFILQRHGGRIALVMSGTATIIGAITGAIVAFICVNILQVFQSVPVCSV